MYSFDDLDELLKGLDDPGYTWSKGYAYDKDGKKSGTYLMGLPELNSSNFFIYRYKSPFTLK